MRIGVAWIACSNANYRALYPLREMARRGHELVLPASTEGVVDPRRLAGCDVVHVYRRADDQTRRALRGLIRRGTAVTFDNDDDLAALPKESPNYQQLGGAIGQRLFAESVKAAKLAQAFTTTTEVLAERYREAGVEQIEVIPNYLSPDAPRPRYRHKGIVIGWVAGIEHQADTARIPIEQVLQRVIDNYPKVRVESIGVRLGLSERYRHDPLVDFDRLPGRIGGYDIGIAPLADIPANRARSDIKLKEYAASGVPWLASPIGPYAGLGEAEGGRLVPDHGWYEALESLIARRRDRARLARSAEAWAQRQMMGSVADRWEQVFQQASDATRPAPPGRSTLRVRSAGGGADPDQRGSLQVG